MNSYTNNKFCLCTNILVISGISTNIIVSSTYK